MKAIFQELRKLSPEAKIFVAIAIIAVLARVFMLFVMADAPLTDTLHHLAIAREIAETRAIPFFGIPELGIPNIPVPLYHVILALPFILSGAAFSFEAVRIFPFIFTALQLLLSFVLLKKLFPKHWVFGMAFVAMQPFLMIYGSVNYLETFASVFVLLCFYIAWRFKETGKAVYIWAMPFALAGLAFSKENATFLVPLFFFAFLYFLWEKRPKRIDRCWVQEAAYLVIGSILLCSAWFVASMLITGSLSSGVSTGIYGLSKAGETVVTPEALFLFPITLNSAFWFFMSLDLNMLPIAVSPELATVAFTLATFPISALLLFGLAKGLERREKHSIILLFLILFSLVLLLSRARKFLHIRLIVPIIPVLGIAFCQAFKEIKMPNWRYIFTFFFVLTTVYSIGFSSYYAWHFGETYREHAPLYEFVKELPEGSAIAINSNKARQISIISGRRDIPHEYFDGLSFEGFKGALDEYGVSHLAVTCYKNSWDKEIIGQLMDEGVLQQVYQDECSTLYEIER